jgi:hypothetical protein
MRLTVRKLKDAVDWPQILNLDPENASWLKLLNLVLEELTNCALWDRTVHRYAICVNESCITWPRQFMGIEAMDICDYPVQLRNRWHEHLENGPGRAHAGQPYNNSYDRGRGFVMFDDITVPSRIRLYPQNVADVGKTVTIRGYNSAGQEVLTNGGQTVGEKMTLAMPFVDSTTIWMRQGSHQSARPGVQLRLHSPGASRVSWATGHAIKGTCGLGVHRDTSRLPAFIRPALEQRSRLLREQHNRWLRQDYRYGACQTSAYPGDSR